MRTITRWVGPGLLVLLGVSGPVRAQQAPPPGTPEPVLSPDIRRDGPPAVRPKDDPGTPPGPNLFYVPGEFYPDGDGVTWREGYWAKEQPGWTWLPAQWVRLSDGWTFREGSWVRTAAQPGAAQAAPQPDSAQAAAQPGTTQAAPIAGDTGVVVSDPIAQQEAVTYNIYTVPDTYLYAPRYVPTTLYSSYLWNPNYVWGGYPWPAGGYYRYGYGGFGYPSALGWPGLGWGGGYGFGYRSFGIGIGIGFGYRPFLW